MLHIVFSREDAQALEKSFELDESLTGEIVVIEEDWSIGPVMGTINSEGITTSRSEWMANLFKVNSPNEDPLAGIPDALKSNPETDAWLWIAPNARSVCGYYFLISKLMDQKGRVYTLWLNNLPFINEKGQIFYPQYLSEIPPREFIKAKKLAQAVSGATFETDSDEWKKMQKENKKLRILEGAKKIAGKEETFLDKEILNVAGNDWQKSQKVLGQLVSRIKVSVNRLFVLWRIRELIQSGMLEGKGDWPAGENFDLRKKQSVETPAHE